jgi:hypothetical protein
MLGTTTIDPRGYDLFVGMDVDKKQIANSVFDHGAFMKSVSMVNEPKIKHAVRYLLLVHIHPHKQIIPPRIKCRCAKHAPPPQEPCVFSLNAFYCRPFGSLRSTAWLSA